MPQEITHKKAYEIAEGILDTAEMERLKAVEEEAQRGLKIIDEASLTCPKCGSKFMNGWIDVHYLEKGAVLEFHIKYTCFNGFEKIGEEGRWLEYQDPEGETQCDLVNEKMRSGRLQQQVNKLTVEGWKMMKLLTERLPRNATVDRLLKYWTELTRKV